MFDEYEQTGTISHTMVDKALYESFELHDDAHKKPEEYTPEDVNHFRNMIIGTRYFIGTAGALALRESVKSKDDLDNAFTVLNDTELTDAQRLSQIGVTQQNIVSSLNAFVQQNRTQTVEKMEAPWQKL